MVVSEVVSLHLGLGLIKIILLQNTKLVEVLLHRIGCHECEVSVNTILRIIAGKSTKQEPGKLATKAKPLGITLAIRETPSG